MTWFGALIVAACGAAPKKQQTSTGEPTLRAEQTPKQPQETQAAAPQGACKRSDMFGPFELNSEEMLKRRGLGDRLFSDTTSSLETPIEVCGLAGQLTWLTNMTCADGSRPWDHDAMKAHGARRGSSIGHRNCGTTVEPVAVDYYKVPCPEKEYDVYIDMYECGPGERFQ